jgi:hypothetical protein
MNDTLATLRKIVVVEWHLELALVARYRFFLHVGLTNRGLMSINLRVLS